MHNADLTCFCLASLWYHKFWFNKFIAAKMARFYGAIIWHHFMARVYCALGVITLNAPNLADL